MKEWTVRGGGWEHQAFPVGYAKFELPNKY